MIDLIPIADGLIVLTYLIVPPVRRSVNDLARETCAGFSDVLGNPLPKLRMKLSRSEKVRTTLLSLRKRCYKRVTDCRTDTLGSQSKKAELERNLSKISCSLNIARNGNRAELSAQFDSTAAELHQIEAGLQTAQRSERIAEEALYAVDAQISIVEETSSLLREEIDVRETSRQLRGSLQTIEGCAAKGTVTDGTRDLMKQTHILQAARESAETNWSPRARAALSRRIQELRDRHGVQTTQPPAEAQP